MPQQHGSLLGHKPIIVHDWQYVTHGWIWHLYRKYPDADHRIHLLWRPCEDVLVALHEREERDREIQAKKDGRLYAKGKGGTYRETRARVINAWLKIVDEIKEVASWAPDKIKLEPVERYDRKVRSDDIRGHRTEDAPDAAVERGRPRRAARGGRSGPWDAVVASSRGSPDPPGGSRPRPRSLGPGDDRADWTMSAGPIRRPGGGVPVPSGASANPSASAVASLRWADISRAGGAPARINHQKNVIFCFPGNGKSALHFSGPGRADPPPSDNRRYVRLGGPGEARSGGLG